MITVLRKYDGYKMAGEIVRETRATMDIQFPGYRGPVRFRASRAFPGRWVDEGDTRGLYFHLEG